MPRSKELEALHRAAETRLKHRCTTAEADAADAVRLLHELQVHQIELEMQNHELLEARGQLESALSHYTELYDFAPVGYFTLDRRGVIRQLNLHAARLLGSNRSALIGQAFSSFIETGQQAAFADVLHRAAIGTSQESCDFGLIGESAVQTHRYVHVDIAPSPSDAALRAVVVDITAARLAQDALERHQTTFKAIMTASPDLVYYVDRQFGIQYINRVPAGLSVGAVMGTDATEYVAPEQRLMVRHTLREVFEFGVTRRFTVLARGDNDRPTWYETIVAPVYVGPEVAYATLLSRDITERVEAEQRYKAMSLRLLGAQEAARRQLAGELHDRTSANLAALGINLDVTDMALNSADWLEVGARMSDNRALLEDTVASIREICTELRPPVLDYAGLMPAIEAYASQFSRRTGIVVTLDCTGNATKLATHVESALFRIVQEALTNVAKHAEAHDVQVRLSWVGAGLHLTVTDDGRGFDAASVTAQGQGLITMRESAAFCGAEFYLVSSPGGGTRVQVDIKNEGGQSCAE